MSLNALGAFVRRARRKEGLSQLALSQKTDGALTNIAISKLENGHARLVSDKQLQALAQALDQPLEKLQELAQTPDKATQSSRSRSGRSSSTSETRSEASAWEVTLLRLAYEKLDEDESDLMLKLIIALLDRRLSQEQVSQLKNILG